MTNADHKNAHPETSKVQRSRFFIQSGKKDHSAVKRSVTEIFAPGYFKKEDWFDDMMEIFFQIKARGSTFKLEIFYGFVHFISCCYILVVAPQQLETAGFNAEYVIVVVGIVCGLGSFIVGAVMNLPFIIAPTSVVSIFYAVYLRSKSEVTPDIGSAAVLISGIILMTFYFKPFGIFIGKLIPLPIQVGTTAGVGMLTCLAGAIEISIVVKGRFSLLALGDAQTPEVLIGATGLIAIGVALRYHVKGAFVIALVGCSFLWWISQNAFPTSVVAAPEVEAIKSEGFDEVDPALVFELVFLYILYLSGVIPTFTELGGLSRPDGSTPRGRWFFLVTGAMTVLSGALKGPPVLISPETGAGIKAGAKTGLSALVCGIFFILSIFFTPIFEAVPGAATAPLLVMIGVILFQDVNRINWKDIEDAFPAYMVMFFIPFTYSIINGVVFGYICYACMTFFSGTMKIRAVELAEYYFPLYSVQLQSFLRVPEEDMEAEIGVIEEDIPFSHEDVFHSTEHNGIDESGIQMQIVQRQPDMMEESIGSEPLATTQVADHERGERPVSRSSSNLRPSMLGLDPEVEFETRPRRRSTTRPSTSRASLNLGRQSIGYDKNVSSQMLYDRKAIRGMENIEYYG